MKVRHIIKTALTMGGSLAAYQMGHGAATYMTRFLEIGEIVGGLAALATLGLGYLWIRKD